MNKPRISLVGADCEQSCRRWTIGNFLDDSGVLLIKDECCKNQQTLLPEPWAGRTIIEEKCDEFKGHLSCLTREEEVLIQKSCLQTWRGAECVLVQPRMCARKQVLQVRQRMSQEEDGFDFRDVATRRLVSLLNCDGFHLFLFLSILLMCSVDQAFLSKISRRCVGANPRSIMCALACVDSGSRQCEENSSNGEVGSDEKSSNLWEEAGLGRQCDRKTWYNVRSTVCG